MTFTLAYPLSKRTLPFRKGVTVLIAFTMFFSGGLIPTYLLVRGLGLIDNRLVFLFIHLISPFHVFLLRNFIMRISDSFEESARIDGAGHMRILTSIIIPLSRPVQATFILWLAMRHWNSWFDAMIYTPSASLLTLQLYLRNILVDNMLFK